MNNPLVSVAVITYNHEKYIRQALDSVLMQKTDFPFEIVIGEDCSTDGTQEIIQSYLSKYPDLIKVITSSSNVGPMANVVRTYKACLGKYIAVLESDDYWTDPLKLQKQVDLLELNKECSLCYTNRYIIDSKNRILSSGNLPLVTNKYLTRNDVIGRFTPPTQTIVFRNRAITPELLDVLKSVYNGDTTLSYFLIREGKFVYLNEITACYRQHEGGGYSKVGNIKRLEDTLLSHQKIKRYFSKKDHLLLNRGYSDILMRLYKEYFFSYKLINLFKTAGKLIINDIRFKQLNFLRVNYWLLKE
jgi:glycosyltransferase involved in cell wall biosynthesis